MFPVPLQTNFPGEIPQSGMASAAGMASDFPGPPQDIRYVCVARRSDRTIVAQRLHTPDHHTDYTKYVQRVLDSPSFTAIVTDRLALVDSENALYGYMDDSGLAYIAVTTKAYPVQHIFDLGDDESGWTNGLLGGDGSPTNTHVCQRIYMGVCAGVLCAYNSDFVFAVMIIMMFCTSAFNVLRCLAVLAREFKLDFGHAAARCAPDELTLRVKVKMLLKDVCDR